MMRPPETNTMENEYHIYKDQFALIGILQTCSLEKNVKTRIERLLESTYFSHIVDPNKKDVIKELIAEHEHCSYRDDFSGTPMSEHRIKVTDNEPINAKQG